jgi:hypothetical protein
MKGLVEKRWQVGDKSFHSQCFLFFWEEPDQQFLRLMKEE